MSVHDIRPPLTLQMAYDFEKSSLHGMAELARKYAIDRPRWWHRFLPPSESLRGWRNR